MRWILGLFIFASTATAQPELADALREARTPADVIRIVGEWERGGNLSLRTITWDGAEVLTGTIVSTFDRDTATYDLDSQTDEANAVASAADARRYGGDVVVYGARTLETVAALAGSYRPYCAGLDSSGLPVLVVNYRGTPTLTVYRGGASFSTLNAKTLLGGANKPSANIGDILSGEADEEADYTHDPRGGVCLPGIIVLNCCTYKYDGSGSRTDSTNYTIDGVSLVYSTDNGATWQLAWRSGNLVVGTPTDFGSEWAITASSFDRAGDDTDFWVSISSYASGAASSRSADTFLTHLTGGSGAWSLSNGYHFAHAQGTGNNCHCHYAVAFKDPNNASGIKYLAELGDGPSDNRTEEYLCSDASAFLTGASADANSVNVVSGGSNWTGPVEINGKTGATAADQWMSSQTISYAPGPNGGWYAGADEGGSSPIFHATVPATDGARVNWLHTYGHSATMLGGASGANANEVNWRCFTLNAWDYSAASPAVAAYISPGSNWPTGYHDCGRVLYKPANETTFGIVYAPQDEESMGSQLRPVLSPDGYIYIGTSNAHGLRRFAAPQSSETRRQQAIFAGPGGTNLALATPVQVTAPGAGNAVTLGTDTPPSTPPTTAAAMHCTAGTTAAAMGVWRITADAVTKTHTTLTVQVLVYTDTIAADSNADTYWRARFYTVEGTSSLATLYRGPNRMEVRGHYTLLTYELKNGAGADDDWDLSGLTAPLQVVMQMQMSGATVHPGEWWQWVVGVYEDAACPPSYLVPPATTGDTESLELSGFTCSNHWTIGAVGILGGSYGRDCRSNSANTFREFLTLWEDADTYIEFACDADDQIRIRCTDGGTVTNTTLTGLPKFLRGDPFISAISYNADTAAYTYSLSVAGTIVANGTIAATAAVKPTKVLLSQDDDGTVRESTRWLYASVDTGNAKGQSQLDDFVGTGGDAPPPPIWRNRNWRTRGR